ncbi:uroporphyrinogen-III synthase [Porphyrobacter sp. GA68]|uniref:uroporphyrinogen-III synthase n=1 Tax=Porphyrobacter sp. GA68 TaxID=2883480 RepID=UPI001D18DDCB|nr:uroporphyrinogen-III synthase [Porphyrobacter sp. GA68]
MTLPLISIRPEPGDSETLARGRAMGLLVERWPLAEVRSRPWQAPAANMFTGLLLGSANAVRHAGAQLTRYADLPVHAVGERTAQAARAAGLQVASTGDSTLQALVDALPPKRQNLLRLAGEVHRPLTLRQDTCVVTRVVYTVEHLPISEQLAERLVAGAAVLLHSGEAGRHFAAECDRLRLPRTAIALAAIAPRVAECAGDGWRLVSIADAPDDGALLQAAAGLLQRDA